MSAEPPVIDPTAFDFSRPLAGIEEIRAVNPHRYEFEMLTGIVHIDPVAHRIDHFAQRLERGARAIELTAAMVGQDDPRAADRGGLARVFGRDHALERELAAPFAHHLLDILPVQRPAAGSLAPLADAKPALLLRESVNDQRQNFRRHLPLRRIRP